MEILVEKEKDLWESFMEFNSMIDIKLKIEIIGGKRMLIRLVQIDLPIVTIYKYG